MSTPSIADVSICAMASDSPDVCAVKREISKLNLFEAAILFCNPFETHDVSIDRVAGLRWRCRRTKSKRYNSECGCCRCDVLVLESFASNLLFYDNYSSSTGTLIPVSVPETSLVSVAYLLDILKMMPRCLLSMVVAYAAEYQFRMHSLKSLLEKIYVKPKPHPLLYGETMIQSITFKRDTIYLRWGFTEVE